MRQAPPETSSPASTDRRVGNGQGEPFEIITVPDFSGWARDIFEGRTILLLASWLEYGGKAKNLPLHLACIGEPPESVRHMAERAGAIVSVHPPLKLAHAHTANKMRGFEVERRAKRLLLIDTDIVFLGDVSSLRQLPDCICAAAGGGARVPAKLWRRLYAELNLQVPEERRPLLRAELEMPSIAEDQQRFEHQNAEAMDSLPYFNSGVVFASWAHGLRSLWAECLERGAVVVDPSEPGSDGVLRSDQAAFALTVASLQARGVEFRRLPNALHTRWRHFYRGKPEPSEIRILHTTGMMTDLERNDGFASSEPIDRWCERTCSRLESVLEQDRHRGMPEVGARRFERGRQLVQDVHERLMRIYDHQIAGVI